jgi:hypothetical protein
MAHAMKRLARAATTNVSRVPVATIRLSPTVRGGY